MILQEQLWVCETNVTAIGGLDSCTKLRELFLYVLRSLVADVISYSNQIRRISGLEKLTELRTLWLNDNRMNSCGAS